MINMNNAWKRRVTAKPTVSQKYNLRIAEIIKIAQI